MSEKFGKNTQLLTNNCRFSINLLTWFSYICLSKGFAQLKKKVCRVAKCVFFFFNFVYQIVNNWNKVIIAFKIVRWQGLTWTNGCPLPTEYKFSTTINFWKSAWFTYVLHFNSAAFIRILIHVVWKIEMWYKPLDQLQYSPLYYLFRNCFICSCLRIPFSS